LQCREEAHNTTRKEVDHDGKIGKAFQCPDVGDVCHPDPVGLLHIELSVEAVVDDHGRSSAIAARSPPISDLGLIPANLVRRATRFRQHVSP
jgi:hypothetical protein